MRFVLGSLLLMLLVSSLSSVHGMLEAHNTNLKCKCNQMTSSWINIRSIGRIQVTPAGNGCPNVEIIVELKSKSTLCLNPEATVTKKLLKILWKIKRESSTSARTQKA